MVDAEQFKHLYHLSENAIKADNSGNLAEAVELYQQAVGGWEKMASVEKNPRITASIRAKVYQFNVRIQEIQNFISSRRPSSSSTQSSSLSIGGGETSLRPGSSPPSPALSQADSMESFRRYLRRLATRQERVEVTFDDVAGLAIAKQTIQESTTLPRMYPNLYQGTVWNGILLYGPPGTGKTLLGKATANATKDQFLYVTSADLVSKWQGESEKNIRALFDVARECAPCVIFVDEIDSLCCSRSETNTESTRRIKTEFLVQMSQITPTDRIVVLGATNTPWDLDPAFLRRFQRRIYVPLPDWEARRKVFELGLRETRHTLSPQDLDRLAEVTRRFTACDIMAVIQDALLEPVRSLNQYEWFKPITVDGKDMFMPLRDEAVCTGDGLAVPMSIQDIPPEQLYSPPIQWSDFQAVARKTQRSVQDSLLRRYTEWTAQNGVTGA
eukprot:Protomagalhaensia_sp_Gyna_25__4990@NODE_547_length_3158_cov_70_291440_g410_i1_p1_GENE_NODE_547_length_3158_cov_70_291440_g410_i1NODE_547_length_3158_cov_70_291440_g410_i1_p1_ORF_typecomplete_len442_score35_29AAA/PF00004_29/5_5e40Vps4_C/PF09336_10/17Vps4_C/PF09336_10/5_4e13MIT/PF04212_18/3_6e10RuvB_N/PF05496_12/1_2e08AAA_5/PF07728_14/3_2e08AAA_22/PF13401_6/2_7e03AAA_22/PF13401_6/1_5e05DUF815/PF05673_13/9_7e07Bac_DnaA/PF00308_18/1_3e06AAA_16/PF13191_6/92AAA_16/PF13191_6/0_00052TniB/PF05621_11/0_28